MIGIDPGLKGGVAAIRTEGKPSVEIWPMPIQPSVGVDQTKNRRNEVDPEELFDMLRWMRAKSSPPVEETIAVLERAQTMRNQGIASAGNYMASYGMIRGVIGALKFRLMLVRPQQWKRHMGLLKSTKSDSIDKARELYPNLPENAKDGPCEALLIARWGLDRL